MNKPAGPEIDATMDANKDGQIDAQELLAAAADKNNDGHVDHTELQDLADQAVTIPTPSVRVNLDVAPWSMDFNTDGKVDAEDIEYLMRTSSTTSWLIVGGVIVICVVLFEKRKEIE